MITKPMLAGTLEDVKDIKFPVICTPKLDGIRCLILDGKAVTRNFKPIPNVYIRKNLEKWYKSLNNNFIQFDGEIITHVTNDPDFTRDNFNDISSKVMSEEGTPSFKYYVFDVITDNLYTEYEKRMEYLKYAIESNPLVIKLTGEKVENLKEFLALEDFYVDHCYEGIMLRDPKSPYKCGRSTLKEGYLLKYKRWLDAEARVIGFVEKMKNNNESIVNVQGYKEKSSHKANLVPANTLGALRVKWEGNNLNSLGIVVEFEIGSGFNDELRKEIWNNKKKYMNKLVKFKYQSLSKDNVPRFPIFLGFRSKNDL